MEGYAARVFLKEISNGGLMNYLTFYMLAPLLMAMAPFWDRMRGSDKDIISSAFEKFMLGACLTGIVFLTEMTPDTLWQWFVSAGLFAIGISPGWSAPMNAVLYDKPMKGMKLSWWMVGPLKDDANAALAVRGLIVGLALLPGIILFTPKLVAVLISMLISLPAAPHIAKWARYEFPGIRPYVGAWELQEYIRSGLASALIFIFMLTVILLEKL